MAIDVGFVSSGVAIFENGNLIHVDCIETKPIKNKQAVYAAHQDVLRIQAMTRGIVYLIGKWDVRGLLVEIPHGGAQSGRAMRAMGLASGMIGSIVECVKLPVEWYLPNQTRIAACGNRKASKDEVVCKISEAYPDWSERIMSMTQTKREACADAISTYEAAKNNSLVRLSNNENKKVSIQISQNQKTLV